jgi:hypothetical protein
VNRGFAILVDSSRIWFSKEISVSISSCLIWLDGRAASLARPGILRRRIAVTKWIVGNQAGKFSENLSAHANPLHN